jgi:hypothetical protein
LSGVGQDIPVDESALLGERRPFIRGSVAVEDLNLDAGSHREPREGIRAESVLGVRLTAGRKSGQAAAEAGKSFALGRVGHMCQLDASK